MTEETWLACTDTETMLTYLQGKLSDRKFRLFACACCRGVWRLLGDGRSRRAVEVAERYADGQATERELATARGAALAAAGGAARQASWAAYWASSRKVAESTWNVCMAAVEAGAWAAARAAEATGLDQAAAWERARATGSLAQVRLLRDVAGNPFRPTVLDPAWLAWEHGTVANMASAIYDHRRFTDLPVLADALEEAGCNDAHMLSHCRAGGEHARGCWVVDTLLGRDEERRGIS